MCCAGTTAAAISDFENTGALPKAKFFHSELINDHMVRIYGINNELMYLVEGSNSAALIDSGAGVGDLKSYVESITSKPVKVLLTHGHVDHIGGASRFENVYMNHDDAGVFAKHNSLETRRGYIHGTYRDAKNLKESDYSKQLDLKKIKDLSSYDSFNLGGVSLEFFDAKGHTPGELAVLLKEDRILIGGDSANQFTFLFDEFSLGLSSYEKSMTQLKKETDGKYDRYFVSHGSGEMSKDTIKNIINLCEEIKAGTTDNISHKFMGQQAYIAKEINKQYQRLDGIDGNIVFSKEKIND
ncbi:Zn-dependent hydrolase [Vibrio sp. HA2012]|nr:Zn-dependent hydrolase [Vibrio sp. HA2012]